MVHWKNILPPDAFFECHYEDLVNNTQQKVRELLNFCQLDWHDSCLEFYKNKRQIRTSSLTQVRQPIYKSSVQRWHTYKDELQLLLKEVSSLL